MNETKFKKIRQLIAKNLGPLLDQDFRKFIGSSDYTGLLYHYTSKENLIKILKSKHLHLTHYKNSCLNDKEEIIYAVEHISNFIKTYQNNESPIFWNQLSTIIKIDNLVFYFSSFCKSNENEILWERYADNSSGICIGFNKSLYDVNTIRNLKNRKLLMLSKVEYDTLKVINYLETQFSHVLNSYKQKINQNDEYYVNSILSELLMYIIVSLPAFKKAQSNKDILWVHENEWRIYRICYSKNFNKKLKMKARIDPSGENFAKLRIKKNAISEIIIGRNCVLTIEEVKTIIKKENYDDISIIKLKQ